jgi:ATP synthase protein I
MGNGDACSPPSYRTADRGPRISLRYVMTTTGSKATGSETTGSKKARRPLGTPPAAEGENPGWTVFSYLLGGMAFYGAVGWAIGHWVIHSALCFPLGMVAGLALSIVLIVLRFGRTEATRTDKP